MRSTRLLDLLKARYPVGVSLPLIIMCAGIVAPFGRFSSFPETIVIWRVSPLKTQKGAVILYALRYELGTEDRVEMPDLTTYPAASKSAMRVARFFAALSDTEWVYFVRFAGAFLISIFIWCFLFWFLSFGFVPFDVQTLNHSRKDEKKNFREVRK